MDTSVESLQYLPSLPHISPVTPLKFNQGLPGVTEDHKAVRKASDYPPPASTVWPSRGENRLHQPASCRGMTSTFSPRTAEWLLSCCDPTTRYERNNRPNNCFFYLHIVKTTDATCGAPQTQSIVKETLIHLSITWYWTCSLSWCSWSLGKLNIVKVQ